MGSGECRLHARHLESGQRRAAQPVLYVTTCYPLLELHTHPAHPPAPAGPGAIVDPQARVFAESKGIACIEVDLSRLRDELDELKLF